MSIASVYFKIIYNFEEPMPIHKESENKQDIYPTQFINDKKF